MYLVENVLPSVPADVAGLETDIVASGGDGLFKRFDINQHSTPAPNFGFSKALNGFLMMLTQNGKLLYISDNAAEYLGHSMVRHFDKSRRVNPLEVVTSFIGDDGCQRPPTLTRPACGLKLRVLRSEMNRSWKGMAQKWGSRIDAPDYMLMWRL
ncbi:Neuronal PAS domain-containing protein 4B [Eumeta japonica]|uniref:Neuronal PAS domain-containing protein 4B n=1 Tax=Eumeta variegata TaxID=151549 RepID=A0A4C1VUH0_EUMVA|nr:Neuronal PAS domain-containing protein 4B [Eumeta japonica]